MTAAPGYTVGGYVEQALGHPPTDWQKTILDAWFALGGNDAYRAVYLVGGRRAGRMTIARRIAKGYPDVLHLAKLYRVPYRTLYNGYGRQLIHKGRKP
ncbi:hypothetical protein SEA_AOKA_45 [Arthrobacter phage Aoka]|nr:hypothetical protein SEA_AOKA_45 [Arthrobacter phage Aoka]